MAGDGIGQKGGFMGGVFGWWLWKGRANNSTGRNQKEGREPEAPIVEAQPSAYTARRHKPRPRGVPVKCCVSW
jgi:hypothetical protein